MALSRFSISRLTCTLIVLASFASPAGAKPAPLVAPDPGRGIIGITLKVIPPAKIGSSRAGTVFFVRVLEAADRFGADSLISSNYAKGRSVYLLNAKPGRYVAVGCKIDMPTAGGPGFAGPAGEGSVVFSEADILSTEVEVRAGTAVFVGAIVTSSSTKTHEADKAQAHYLHMISPRGASESTMKRAFAGHYVYTAKFKSTDRSEATEQEFWSEAVNEHFKDQPEWANRIAGRSTSPTAAAHATPAGATPSSVDFVRTVCMNANTAKARANGLAEGADMAAGTVCERVTADWTSHGCADKPEQSECKQILGRMDHDLRASGSSMLFAAAQAGRTSICSAMLAAGSDPSAATSNSWTPLMVAADQGHVEIVKLLIGAGADPNARNVEGATALELATASGKQAVADTLREAGNSKAAPPQPGEPGAATPRTPGMVR